MLPSPAAELGGGAFPLVSFLGALTKNRRLGGFQLGGGYPRRVLGKHGGEGASLNGRIDVSSAPGETAIGPSTPKRMGLPERRMGIAEAEKLKPAPLSGIKAKTPLSKLPPGIEAIAPKSVAVKACFGSLLAKGPAQAISVLKLPGPPGGSER